MIIGDINVNKERQDEIREDLLYEKREIEYNLDDLYLVRSTNFLPIDGTIKPISQIPFFIKNNSLIRRVILEHIKDLYNPNLFDEEVYDKINRYIKDNYLPLSTQYRSTVHFTINGRVTSHSKGDFDHNDFVLIDPLKYHIKNNNIVGLKVEDTYMQGEVKLSNELVVLVNKDKYQELLNKHPELANFNVILYTGDEKLAVEAYFESINVIPEKISEHGSKEHTSSNEFNNILMKISQVYNIPMEAHYYSNVYQEDDEKSLILWDYYNKEFFSLLLSKFNLSKEEYNNRLNILSDLTASSEACNLLSNMIDEIGYEAFKNIVLEFNTICLNKVKDGSIECNDELLQNITGKIK